jgi:chloramphenicol-sensitive protein RarD
MKRPLHNQKHPQPLAGLIYSASAFLIWGISPLYWKALKSVPAFEIILHRVVWSFVFLILLIIFRHRWDEFLSYIKTKKVLATMLVTALLVSCNWLVYIWAVNNGFLLQASLGYYINPLVNVLLGFVFLKERLRRYQRIAVILAGAGVLYLTIFYGQFPWIALTLAGSFGLYGLIRKVAPVGSLVGLAMETLILSIPSILWLLYLDRNGSGSFLNSRTEITLLLMGASVVTALPLLLFNLGAKRVTLATLGFMQYIAPSCMFIMAVFIFGEPFIRAQLISFVMIWAALAVYSFDSVIVYRKHERVTQ